MKGLRIGLLTEGFAAAVHDPKVSELVRKAASRLEALGAVVSTVSVPMHKNGPDLWAVIGRLGASQVALGRSTGRRHLALDDFTAKSVPITQESFNDMFVSSKNTIINGEYGWKHMDPTLYGKATNLVRKLRDAYDGAMDEVDILLMPTLPNIPPKHIEEGSELDEVMKNCTGVTLNTAPFNLVSTLRSVKARRGATAAKQVAKSWPRHGGEPALRRTRSVGRARHRLVVGVMPMFVRREMDNQPSICLSPNWSEKA